jgi:hypothetical protein
LNAIKTMITMLPLMALGECMQTYGSTYCDAGEVNEINASGIVNVNKTNVLGMTDIKGSLNAKNATFKSLFVYGNAYLKDVKIYDETKVYGFLEAMNSDIQNMEISADKMILDHTSIHQILVKPSQSGLRLIVLRNGATVSGNVCFEGGRGQVRLESGSSINGQVINGDVIEIN